MKKLSQKKIESITGGSWTQMSTIAGGACAAAVTGAFFGPFGFAVSAALFGPTCIGLTIAAAIK
ncbi:MAG: hypothetical protein K2Q21_04010 [Chitinophagaceae bacterium]|nr:hypothetical protein [Chitinophagaceae bacterium]